MQNLYESRFKIIEKIVAVNNRVAPKDFVNSRAFRETTLSSLSLAYENETLSRQEFDLITLGLLILVLSRAQNQPALTPYCAFSGQAMVSPSIAEIKKNIVSFVPDLLRKNCFLTTGHPEAFYFALQIGFKVLNREIQLDLTAFASNVREVFSAEMAAEELQNLELWIGARVFSDEFVPSVCLAVVDPSSAGLSYGKGKSSLIYINLHRIADRLSTAQYPDLGRALLEGLPDFVGYTRDVSDSFEPLCRYLESGERVRSQELIKYLGHVERSRPTVAEKGLGGADKLIAQLKKMIADCLVSEEAYKETKQAFIEKYATELSSIIPKLITEQFGQTEAYHAFQQYGHNLTPENIETETSIMSWGLAVMAVAFRSSEMLPYLSWHEQEISPTVAELKAVLKLDDLEVHSDKASFGGYYARDIETKKTAALSFLIGKKICRGELKINIDNFKQNIANLGRKFELEAYLQVNPDRNQPIHSAGLTALIKGGVMHGNDLFEEAVFTCKDARLKEAVSALWRASLTACQFPLTQNTLFNRNAPRINEGLLTRSELNSLARNTLEFVKTGEVNKFKNAIAKIREKMRDNRDFMYRLDTVIQIAIGLGLGLAVSLVAGTAALPTIAIGACLGLASTRFGLWHQGEYDAYHKMEQTLAAVSSVPSR